MKTPLSKAVFSALHKGLAPFSDNLTQRFSDAIDQTVDQTINKTIDKLAKLPLSDDLTDILTNLKPKKNDTDEIFALNEQGIRIAKQCVTDKAFLFSGLLFAGFHFSTTQNRLIPIFKKVGLSEEKSIIVAGATRKYVGGVVLGVGSGAYLLAHRKSLSNHGLTLNNLKKSVLLTATLSPIFVGIVAANMKQPVMWQYYPEIRGKHFTPTFAVLSASSWLAYLTGFEFMFRGFLLHHWQEKYSTADALAMTTVLYTLVHLPNNWREMLSCIPMGYIFGGMSLATNSMLSPYLMHGMISITSDVMAAKYNPEMTFLA